MPTNPNRFNPNPKRTTLSAPSDPRQDPRPQKAAQEEEKTRQALSNLRRKNTDLNEGIRALEAAIGEPAFRRLIEQVTSAESSLAISSEPCSSSAVDAIGELRRQQIERIRRMIGPKLAQNLANSFKKDQKLHFALLDLREIKPKLFYAEWEQQILISIIGPSDIRKRSSGAIRIADQILSFDSTIFGAHLFDQNNNNNNNKGQQPKNGGNGQQQKNDANHNNHDGNNQQQNGQLDRLGRAREFAEKYIQEAASKEPPHLVLGLLRQSAKIMAWSGNEQIGNRLSKLTELGEQDGIWMMKRALKKQNAHDKIVQLTGDWVQVQIVHLPNEPDGLGFGIVGGHSTGVVIKSIISGSVADKDQRLRPGDRILQIGHISTQGLNSQQIAALLRQQDGQMVQLTVGRPIQVQETEMNSTPMCWTMATRAALTASTLEEEVQNRLELLANTPSTSATAITTTVRCNGIQPHRKGSSNNPPSTIIAHQFNAMDHPAPMNEATEYPDQLPRILAETNIDSEENRPSTSTGGGGQSEREGHKKSADKTHSNPLEIGPSGRRKNTHQRTSRGPSNDNPSCSSSSERRSLRQLQEMALTSFCRDKWLPGRYKMVDVELERDPKIGLGITVAGYVYRKEEINGVFIKSLVPQSSAHLSNQIQLHDLIVEVNGRSLEGLSHSDSVRTLIRSGLKVRLKLVRFEEDTPQAKCLKMLHEQELAAAAASSRAESGSSSTCNTTNRGPIGTTKPPSISNGPPLPTSISPVPPPPTSIALAEHQQKQSLVDYKSFWSNRVGPEYDIVVVDLRPDERVEEDGGLGIEWQGTVDIRDGNQLCSHHFIESLRSDGPAAKTGILKAGDELLQVNEITLFGESFVKVRNVLSRIRQENAEFVRLIFCRKSEQDHLLSFVLPSPEQTLPLAYPLLASLMAAEEHFVKAKSELRLCDLAENGSERYSTQKPFAPKIKSRSVENLSGLAIWNCVPIVVALRKDAKGLGFSVADYQDPLHPEERVIVIRSLVPGGAAQADGRIVPGDRLLFVNAEDLSSSTLERAVEVLKAAPIGQIVRLGIAKPVPIEQCRLSTAPLISRSERLLAKSHSPLGRRRRGGGGPRTKDDLLAAQSHLLNATIDPCCSSTAGSSQEEIWVARSSLNNSQRCLNPQLYFPSSGTGSTPISPTSPLISAAQSPMAASAWTPCSSRSLSPCASPAASSLRGSWSYDIVFLPTHLERHIKVLKGSLPLGVVLDSNVDKAINGCVAKSICSKKAVARDGRIQPSDYLVRINGESLRNVTNAQARAIMKRANLVGAQCNISYITASDARLWKERSPQLGQQQFTDQNSMAQNANQQQYLEQSRLSPKIYPKFYRSPILDQGKVSSATTSGSGMPSPRTETEEASSAFNGGREKEMATIKKDEADKKMLAEMAERMMKEIFSEAIFDLYILWSQKAEQHNNWRDSLAQNASTSLAIPPSSPNQQKSQRSASIGVATGLGPSDAKEEESGRGLFRRATSSLRKKRSDKATAAENGHVQQIEPQASSKTSKMNPKAGTETVENVDEGKKMAPGTMMDTEAGTSQQELRPINFWSEPRSVVLSRNPNETFGISIVGGRVEVSQKGPMMEIGGNAGTSSAGANAISSTVAGIFIKSVVADSPAGRCGQLFMGDRLLSVNNVDLSNSTHETAVQVIKSAQNPVTFRVQSLQTLQSYGTTSQNAKRPSQASVFSEKSEAERRAATASTSTAIIEIDSESAAALQRAEDDLEPEDEFRYTKKKVERKYKDLPGEPVLLRMANIPSGGLGLILSTKRDEQDEEHRPPVIVVGVKSDSPLSLNVGDELLEINGRVLFGLSHHEATEKIRQCCQHNGLSLLILRKTMGGQKKDDADSQQETFSRERKRTNESVCEAGARQIVAEVLARQMGGDDQLAEKNKNAAIGGRKKSDDAADHQTNENNLNEIRPDSNCRDRAKLSSETVKSAASAPGTLQSVGSGGNDAISRKRSWQMEQQQSQFLQKCPIQVGQETLIEIDKDGKGLGLSIVGGSDTVLGTVVIHEVYPDGAAAIDGRLRPGDQVLEVNSTSLRAISHEQAITLLRRTPAKVRLLIYRDQNLQMSLLDPTQIYNIFTIDLVKKAGKGLGISIVGRKNEPGVYVSEIVKGGVADGDGRLMQGDQILAVNGQDVANCMQEDVATILKTSTGKIGLKIGRWKLTETTQKVRSAQPPAGNGATGIGGQQQQQQNNVNNASQMPLQQQQNINETTGASIHSDSASGSGPTNGIREPPPPPAPMPVGGGLKLPPPTLQITLHDENNQQQSLMGGVRSDLSPVSEEDLKSIAETVASEDQSAVTTSSSSQRRPLNQLPNTVAGAASASSVASSSSQTAQQQSSSSPSNNNHHHAANTVKMRTDLKESGCESLLIVLRKEDGQQWGMGIGKRPRGILITSLQPGSSAAEKLAIGDRIMAVNAQEVTTQHSAVTFIRSSGNSVALQISRPIKPFISS